MSNLRSFGRLVPKLSSCFVSRNSPLNNCIKIAVISTSRKSKDTVSNTIIDGGMKTAERDPDENVIPKNWVSWGYDYEDIVRDNTVMHIVSFCAITLCFVGGAFIFMYMPDNRMAHWHQREAFLELRRREAEGLPLVDRNLITENKVELPSDEELGDVPIII